MLGNVVGMCSNNFTTHEKARAVEEFFKNKDTKGYDRALAQSIDSITAKAMWAERDAQDVEDWLKKNKYIAQAYERSKL